MVDLCGKAQPRMQEYFSDIEVAIMFGYVHKWEPETGTCNS